MIARRFMEYHNLINVNVNTYIHDVNTYTTANAEC